MLSGKNIQGKTHTGRIYHLSTHRGKMTSCTVIDARKIGGKILNYSKFDWPFFLSDQSRPRKKIGG